MRRDLPEEATPLSGLPLRAMRTTDGVGTLGWTAPEPVAGTAALFELQQVDVRLGSVMALSDVSIRIAHGERVALVGANGCGKSTLLRLLNGLLQPVGGRCLRDPGVRQAMLFQRPHLLRLSALSNVALALWLSGVRWREAREQALAALQHVGMADLAYRNGRSLSGGQQQRLALARAWASRPNVLLLDEPTASLDPRVKHDIERLITDFAAGHGRGGGLPVSLVFASHNLGQVKRLATRVIYLEDGRVLADLPVDVFFNGRVLQSQYPAAYLFIKGELP